MVLQSPLHFKKNFRTILDLQENCEDNTKFPYIIWTANFPFILNPLAQKELNKYLWLSLHFHGHSPYTEWFCRPNLQVIYAH